MSKKFLFLISLVLALSLASAGYGDSSIFKLDFDDPYDPNTEPGFTSFMLADSGSEVNGVIIDLGGNIEARRREDPNSNNEFMIPILNEQMYRDFIFGIYPSGITITLWELGDGRKCKIYIYAYDDDSESRRVANWTANGDYLLTTDFEGGDSALWPFDPNWWPGSYLYDFNGIAHADEFGRIVLESTIDPCSTDGQPFAYANALVVIQYGDYNDVEEARRPQPTDGQEGVPVDTVLSWIPGAYVDDHDVYFGTTDTPTYQTTVGTNNYDPPGFLELDQTYYWRVDEVNLPHTWPGEVWSFTTLPYFVVEDFDSYVDTDDLLDVWDDYFANGTSAQLDLVETGEASQRPVRDGNSIEYWFRNDYDPHYSVAEVDIADLPSGISSDWLGMNVKSLALWFFGQKSNPVNSRMYVSLTDGDGNSAAVQYGVYDPREDMNDIRVEEWQEWNIAMQEFLDENDVNLANVKTISIGFGDGSAEDDGIVYFDDITVHTTRCVLVERSDDFARVDYAPSGNPAGDCVIDYLELEVIARTWLFQDSFADTNIPSEDGLVVYYSMETMTGADPCDPNRLAIKPYPYDPCKIGFFSEFGVTSSTSGVVIENDPCNTNPSHLAFDANCVHFDGLVYNEYPGEPDKNATAITCGRDWSPIEDSNELTLAVWIRWAGPHVPYRFKAQPIISMRRAWSDSGDLFSFECDPYPDLRGSFYIRRFNGWPDGEPNAAVYSEAGILDTSIDQWAHLAVTYDGTDDDEACRLYLNGAEVTNGRFTYGLGDPCEIELTIGNHDTEGLYIRENFHGDIDEIYIYNRVLGPDEIAYLADTSPADWKLQIPIPSGAEVYTEEPVGQRIVNFKDFAVMANYWLEEEMWP